MGGIAVGIGLAFGGDLGDIYGDALDILRIPFHAVDAADVVVGKFGAAGGAQAEFGGNLAVSRVFDVDGVSGNHPDLAHMIAGHGGQVEGREAGGGFGLGNGVITFHGIGHDDSRILGSLCRIKAESGGAQSRQQGDFFSEHGRSTPSFRNIDVACIIQLMVDERKLYFY